MKIFKISIELRSGAMTTTEDIAEALEKTACKVRDYGPDPSGGEYGRVVDRNGHAVGSWGFYVVRESMEP